MVRLFMLLGVLIAGNAYASGDEGLYDGVAPPGSTFVRVLNANAKGNPVNSIIAKSTISEVPACNASSYIFLPEGKLNVNIEGIESALDFRKDRFYSVIFNQGGITLKEDTYFKNRRKALVSLYNLTSDTTLDLTVNNGAVKVIEGVAAGQYREREINAVKIDMQVFSTGVEWVNPPVQVLTRGDVYSLFVCGSKGSATANWLKWDVLPAS